MPDFTAGYYVHKPDLNFAIAYRSYGTATDTYGVLQQLKRRSILFEATKYLFDYHGFVPFIGPALSYENLAFEEKFEEEAPISRQDNLFGYGLTFGWDIRPNRIQNWLLRTNLRWYPDLNLSINADTYISFNNIEFNFIQLVIFPGRMFG